MDRYERMYQEIQEMPNVEGISPTDILLLPKDFEPLMRTLMRKGSMTVEDFAHQLELPLDHAQNLGDLFVEKGYLRTEVTGTDSELVYRVYLARMRKHNIPSSLFD